MPTRRLAALLSALSLSARGAAMAQDAMPAPPAEPAPARSLSFFDPEDGMLDASDFLLNHKGALPVPMIITESAVGYGFGLGLMFFSESMAEAAANARASGKGPAPPNITGIGGAYTENGTWGAESRTSTLGTATATAISAPSPGGCPARLLRPVEPGAGL